jgi:tetratricopeptide (TPR) repeat protein
MLPESAAFAGAAAAYFAQSFVSIDELSIRLAFWTALAGVAACRRPQDVASGAARRVGRPSLVLGVGALLLAGLASSTTWTAGFVLADHRVREGMQSFRAGRTPEAIAQFEAAIDLRDDPEYLALYGEQLGLAALERGPRAEDFTARMRRAFSYLARLPDIDGMVLYARLLEDRASYRADLLPAALGQYERTARLDPHNPVLRAGWAETLILARRPHAAVALLDPLRQPVGRRHPDFWAVLSLAHSGAGNLDEARIYLARSESLDGAGCKTLIARELLPARALEGAPSPVERLEVRIGCDASSLRLLLELLPPGARGPWRDAATERHNARPTAARASIRTAVGNDPGFRPRSAPLRSDRPAPRG